MKHRHLISESEELEIKKMYGLLENFNDSNNSYIFDLVITENKKYMIFMDQLFSKEKGAIGNLWENTWVFNEIITEKIMSGNQIVIEGVESNIKNIIDNIEWTKELFCESILNFDYINESVQIDEQFWDKLKQTASNVGNAVVSGAKKIGSGLANVAKKIVTGAILPALRWIRRNAYTSIGMVIDIITAMIPVTTGINKLAWLLIVILDLYEIISGDFDTNDPERQQSPYMFLVIDLIAFAFSAAASTTVKVGLQAGAKKMPSATVKLMKSLLEKLPSLKNTLKTWGDWLVIKLPKIKNIIDKIFSGIDKVLTGVETFIKQLFSKKGVAAVGTAAAVTWFFKERDLGVGDNGQDVLAVNQYFVSNHNNMWPECTLSQNVVNSIKQDGNKFTKNTEKAVKMFEGCLINHSVYGKDAIKTVDGKITNTELALYTNIEMDDRNLVTKFIPHSTKEAFKNTISAVLSSASKGLESVIPKGGNQNKVVISKPVTSDNTQRTTNNNTVSITQDIDNLFQK